MHPDIVFDFLQRNCALNIEECSETDVLNNYVYEQRLF